MTKKKITKRDITLKINTSKGWINLSRYLQKFEKQCNCITTVWHVAPKTYKIEIEPK